MREILQFLQGIGFDIDEYEIQSFNILFEFIDQNKDNIITKEEFISAISTIDEAKQAVYKRLSDKNIEVYSVPSSDKKLTVNTHKFKLRNEINNLDLTNAATSFTPQHIEMLNKFVELSVDDLLLEIQFADWCKAFLGKVWNLKCQIADIDSFLLDFFTHKYNEMVAGNTQITFEQKK